MSEFSLESSIELIQQRAEDITIAYEQAAALEARASKLREDAVEGQALAFESASASLLENFNVGKLTALQSVTAVARLDDLDPKYVDLYKGQHGDQIIEHFKALQIGAPVLELAHSGSSATGIVIREPEVVELNARAKSRSANFHQPFMAPWGKFAVSLATLRSNGEREDRLVSAEIGSLRTAVIGRAAVHELVEKAEFTEEYDQYSCHPGTTTNGIQLRALKANVVALHQLGMEPVDTTALDTALSRAEAYAAQQRRRAAARRRAYPIRYR